MKVAICFSGLIRTWDIVKDNIKNCLDIDNADIFAVTDSLLKDISCERYIITPNNISLYKNHLFYFSQNCKDILNIENAVNMFYKIYKCNQLKKEYEDENNFKYDFVIRARCDVKYNEKLILKNDKNTLYVPFGNDYNGLNDQFSFGDSETMDKVSDLYLNINDYVKNGCIYHPETLLGYHVNKCGLIVNRDVNIKLEIIK
jgi:hypothetical protein